MFCVTGFTRLKVGEVGTKGGAHVLKFIHRSESTVEESDSSHSGIVAGGTRWPRVGLLGAEAAKKGKLNDADCLAMDSQLKFCMEIPVVDDDRGGVTGQLFEIRSGGRDDGLE